MYNPPPPEGPAPGTDPGVARRMDSHRPEGVRSRQTSMWLVFAVLAAIVVVILAVSFNRTDTAEPTTTATKPAPDAGTATTGTATTEGTAGTGTSTGTDATPEATAPATTPTP